MKTLCIGVTNQIPNYFNAKKRELYRNFRSVFDPKQYRLYQSVNAASGHGSNVIDSMIKGFKEKRIKIGKTDSYKTIVWRALDVNKLKYEYKALRILLYQNRNVYPKDLDARLTFILFKLEQSSNLFPMTILLLTTVLTYFSGVIDVERCNGTKKCMVPSFRDTLKTEKLDKILRIYYNSPDIDDIDELNKWAVEVVKIWYSIKPREYKCDELDRMCNLGMDVDNDC